MFNFVLIMVLADGLQSDIYIEFLIMRDHTISYCSQS